MGQILTTSAIHTALLTMAAMIPPSLAEAQQAS